MTRVVLQKMRDVLVPADEQSAAFLTLLRNGEGIEFDARVTRNAKFHRKAFKLFRLAFETWAEQKRDEREETAVAFERFREWLLILAGHSDEFFFPDGSMQVRARSISFEDCDEMEFNDIYSRVLDVCWQRIFRWARYRDKQEVERTVNHLVAFG